MPGDGDTRREQNRYAREVLSGSQVQLLHRPMMPQPAAVEQRGAATESITARSIYLAALVVLGIIGIAVYLVAGFQAASVMFFLLSIVLLAGWYVF